MNNFTDIISESSKLLNIKTLNSLNVKIFTNSIINPIDKILKYQIEKKNIKTFIEYNDFDSLNFLKNKENIHIAIILWEIENIFPNGFLDLEFKDNSFVEEVIEVQINRLNIFFDKINESKLIIFKKFNNFNYFTDSLYENKVELICNKLNQFLEKNAQKNKNIILFDDFDIYKELNNNYYSRNLKNAKLPYYSLETLMHISFRISLIVLNYLGQSKKVLIVDCDNTLWNGIIGEDDNNKIFSRYDIHREKFKFASKTLSYLKNKGIILAVCSKNNYQDVEKFFKKKSKYLFDFENFNVKKINWNSKSQNILEMSKELNLGTSSFVFLDDSEFEISEVQTAIKDIDCIKVPNNLDSYKQTLLNICKYFNKKEDDTKEDKLRSKFYTQEDERLKLKNKNSYQEYLKSLNLELYLGKAEFFELGRVAQLTQKTNQFNLTLERQTLNEVKKKIKSKNREIYAFSLRDKFGEYGTVGVADILFLQNKTAIIENFLMSCRVMGREVEQTFLAELIKIISKKKIINVEGIYVKGPKNDLVKDFYSQNGFKVLKNVKDKKVFSKEISTFLQKNKKQNKIKVVYAK